MKKNLLLAMFAVFFLTAVSYADNFTLLSPGYENGSNVSVVLPVNDSADTFAAYLKMNFSGVDYMGYCVDYASVDWNTLYNDYKMLSLPNEDRYKEAAWLFETYGTNPATSGKNVQLAIWEIIFDQGDPNHSVYPSDGLFYVTSAGSAILATVQGYVNEALTHSDFDASSYQLLVSPLEGPFYGEVNQDFIIKTPEPGMLALLGIGLLGLVLVTRRKDRS
jgi:hypothetical protein